MGAVLIAALSPECHVEPLLTVAEDLVPRGDRCGVMTGSAHSASILDISAIGIPIPANTFVAEHIPHEQLLPRVDVLVTSGGYGAVQRALATGVPVVVAGSTADKPEVAARVAWSGAGLNLSTGTPSPAEVGSAVGKIRSDMRYLRNARRLEAAFARRDGVAEIAALIDEVVSERRKARAR